MDSLSLRMNWWKKIPPLFYTKMCWGGGAPGLKPSLFQIRYGDISLRYYDNPERSCAGVYKIETHAWAPRIPWHLTSGEKQMNLNYKELRREAPTRNIMESKHTEAAPPEGRRFWTENLGKLLYSVLAKRYATKGGYPHALLANYWPEVKER